MITANTMFTYSLSIIYFLDYLLLSLNHATYYLTFVHSEEKKLHDDYLFWPIIFCLNTHKEWRLRKWYNQVCTENRGKWYWRENSFTRQDINVIEVARILDIEKSVDNITGIRKYISFVLYKVNLFYMEGIGNLVNI